MKINIKNRFTLLSISILILGSVIAVNYNTIVNAFYPHQVFASGGLVIDWGIGTGNVGPVFDLPNIAPGDSLVRQVTIKNNDTSSRPLGIKALLTDGSTLDEALIIKITNNSHEYYHNSLKNLFNASIQDGIKLNNINPGEELTYDILITFAPESDNTYQQKSITFDIIFGIAFDIPSKCSFIDMTGKFPIFGTDKKDNIRGTTGSDLIYSFEGNDTINGNGGRDCVISGIGNDTVYTGNNDDYIDTGDGNDYVKGGNGNDILEGKAGIDQLDGGNGNDTIYADMGDDILDGGNGNDTIYAGEGNDDIDGGNGQDHLYGEQDNDTIQGGNDHDLLDGGEGNNQLNGGNGKDKCISGTKTKCEL